MFVRVYACVYVFLREGILQSMRNWNKDRANKSQRERVRNRARERAREALRERERVREKGGLKKYPERVCDVK